MNNTCRYEVELHARGNPDFGEPHDLGLLPVWREVPDYSWASQVCRDWLHEHDYGAGNWAGGRVRTKGDGRIVARVSFNGRVWEGDRCVYDPSQPLTEAT